MSSSAPTVAERRRGGEREADAAALASLASKLRMAVARLARRLRQQDEGGLSHPMLSALSTLQHGPMTLKDLAAAEHVQPPTMTVLMTKLEEAGLVARAGDPTDGRVRRMSLTSRGTQVLERARSRRTAYLARRLRSLPADEREVLDRAADIIERLIREAT